MSTKTLSIRPNTNSIKKPPVDPLAADERQVKPFTAAELRAMLAELEPAGVDSTMNLPTGAIPAHLIADKSLLPPVDQRTSTSIQPPANTHGRFDINGIPVIAPGVHTNAAGVAAGTANIDPSTGYILAQVMPANRGGCISPSPTKFFK